MSLDFEQMDNLSLASGLSGCALGLWAVHRFISDTSVLASLERIDARLNELLNEEGEILPGLFGGIAGVAYAEVRYKGLISSNTQEYCDDLDQMLLEFTSSPGSDVHFDLVGGIAGIAQHSAVSGPSPARAALLTTAVRWIEARSEPSETGLSWRTAPWHYGLEASATTYPRGTLNLGVAHGVPGVIGALTSAVRTGHGSAVALLDRACSWMINIEAQHSGGGIPYLAEDPATKARLAWCYGDAGVAVVLVNAGIALQRTDVIEVGNTIGLRALARTLAVRSIQDATLCHGAAGWLLIFSRLYRSTSDERYLDGVVWCRKLLFDRFCKGGIDSLLPPISEHGEVHHLLNGTLGVALALLDSTNEEQVDWATWLAI